jgi:hypothetical protein
MWVERAVRMSAAIELGERNPEPPTAAQRIPSCYALYCHCRLIFPYPSFYISYIFLGSFLQRFAVTIFIAYFFPFAFITFLLLAVEFSNISNQENYSNKYFICTSFR